MPIELITLRDDATGATAKVLAGFGFNCFSFRPVVAGEPIETLWAAANFESGKERPSGSGIPLLFPFPGRIGRGVFEFNGMKHLLSKEANGNAIHGFCHNRPWKVVEQTPRKVVGEFQASKVDGEILKQWPADFKLTVSYELSGTAALVSRITIENPSDQQLPWGLGTHPYFRVPLGKAGKVADCCVTVPASEYWELENMLPTGKRLKAEGDHALANGIAFPQTKFDTVFAGLSYDNGLCRTTIHDSASGRNLCQTFDKQFRACVVYNPPHREAICMEPYTCIPDAFRLQAAGHDAGGAVMPPSGKWSAEIQIELT